ncbi:MAG: YraN family protein [Helicobacteraceae bacterium]|nr:YraN family protein [Helicobacteraceae bacterium]
MSRSKGFAAEDRACERLKALGFEIVDRNFYEKFGEIDIVAAKDGVIHFVEVKSGENFDPINAITPAKLSRVIKTAESWLQKRRLDAPFCIDALCTRGGEFELIENITM